ncbi:hypothetical protein [Wolbachia endosymbiont (group A) of Sphecodes monilicornis]|nr:hypothetical protein [Wolbachia endosymbiont (group A) of Sphecodes monilicornis]
MTCSDYYEKCYNFSGNLTKIELELINEKYMQVQVNRERKIILAIP